MRKYFKMQMISDNPFRVFNISLMLFFILMLGFIRQSYAISSFASLGLFTFFYYQNIALKRLMKRLLWIGLALGLVFVLGVLSSYAKWTAPLLVGLVAFLSRFILRLYHIYRPGALFFAMLSAMGANLQLPLSQLPMIIVYFFIGMFLAILVAFITKLLDKRAEQTVSTLSIIERFYSDSLVIVDAVFYGGALFLSVYLSHGLNFQNPYWVTLACGSLLVVDNIEAAKERHIQYLLGTVIGLMLATLILNISLTPLQSIISITLLYGLAQYFVVRNYAWANFFINPMVLLLSGLLRGNSISYLIEYRFLGILVGSCIGFATAWLLTVGLAHYLNVLNKHRQNILNMYEDKK